MRGGVWPHWEAFGPALGRGPVTRAQRGDKADESRKISFSRGVTDSTESGAVEC